MPLTLTITEDDSDSKAKDAIKQRAESMLRWHQLTFYRRS
jgi:hypothetical protein